STRRSWRRGLGGEVSVGLLGQPRQACHTWCSGAVLTYVLDHAPQHRAHHRHYGVGPDPVKRPPGHTGTDGFPRAVGPTARVAVLGERPGPAVALSRVRTGAHVPGVDRGVSGGGCGGGGPHTPPALPSCPSAYARHTSSGSLPGERS